MTSGNLTEITLPLNQSEIKPKQTIHVGHFVAAFVIFAVAIMLYSLTRLGGFEGDDLALLGQLQEKNSLGDALGYLTRNWGLEGQYYAPLPRIFFWLEYSVFGNRTGGWHIMSALLHGGAALGVWWLGLLLARRFWLGFWAGLFFAVQPAHTKVVLLAAGQAEVLATIFCVASVAAYITARRGKTKPYFILAVVFYALGLLCKQEAIAVPLVLVAYDFITGGIDRIIHSETGIAGEHQSEKSLDGRQMLSLYLPFVGILIVYILLNFAFVGGLNVFLPTATLPASPGDFLRNNLRYLADPFDLAGTDGLILIAALVSFLALVGVQEWEAWRVTHREALAKMERPNGQKKAKVADEELDDPEITPLTPPTLNGALGEPAEFIAPAQSTPTGNAETDSAQITPAGEVVVPSAGGAGLEETATAASAETSATTIPAEEEAADVQPQIGGPGFRTLRVAGYGLIWAGAFLLPFILTAASERTLYLASVGFALFLAAVLTPFSLALLPNPEDRKAFPTLYGPRELSFWLRLAAALMLAGIYFSAAIAKIDEFNRITKTAAMVISAWFKVV